MTTLPRYLIAKYVPDVRRMEPENIGVILWTPRRVASRFRDAPPSIHDKQTYHRWVTFWQRQIQQPELPIETDDETSELRVVARNKPEFLDALRATQKGNYLLFDGGHVMERLRTADVSAAVSFLYEELVAPPATRADQESANRLKELCNQIFEDTGLRRRNDFRRSFETYVQVFGVWKHVTFNYALGDTVPSAVFQRVVLTREQSVHSSALMLDCITNQTKKLSKERCGVFVDLPDEELTSDAEARENLELLDKLATVVNVSRYEDALLKVESIASQAA